MPKVVQKNGYNVVQNTGLESFAQALAGVFQGFQQAQQQKQANLQRAEEVKTQQAQFRLQMASLYDKDPEQYNILVQDPAIRHMMDPARVEEAARGQGTIFDALARRKAANDAKTKATTATGTAGAAPGTPTTTDFLPQLPVTENFKKRQQAELAQSEATIDTSKYAQLRAQVLAGKISSKDAGDQLFGLTGTPMDIGQMSAAYYKEHPDVFAQEMEAKTPGTDAWKRIQATNMLSDLVTKYRVTDKTDLEKLRTQAEWQAGLLSEPPENLPKSYAGLEYDLNMAGQKLRERSLGIDIQRLNLETNVRIKDTAMDMINAGIDPRVAVNSAEQLLKTGKLPPGTVLPPDRMKQLEISLAEKRIQQIDAEIKKAAAEDPNLNAALALLSRIPQGSRDDSAVMIKVKELIGNKLGIDLNKDVEPGLWDRIKGLFSGANVSSALEGVPRKSTPTQTPAPSQTSELQWTPELLQSAQQTSEAAEAMFMNRSPDQQAQIRDAQARMIAANKTKDSAAMLRAINDLAAIIKGR